MTYPDHWCQDTDTGLVAAANIDFVAAIISRQVADLTRLSDGTLLDERTPDAQESVALVSDTALRHSTQTLSGTTTFSYDGANRLHQAVEVLNGGGGDTYVYGYDAANNRTSAAVNGAGPSYSYNAADELTTAGTTYDADGNLTAAPSYGYSAFVVNDANKTLSITPNSQSAVAMDYAGATQQHWRQDGNTSLVTAANIGIVAATTGGQASYYTRLPDGTLLDERTPAGTYNYLTDAQGSVAVVADTSGNIADAYNYDPYGNTTSSIVTAPNPWRYASGYQDDQSGLYKYGARYYNPNLGQWTQSDPTGQDPNPYTYTGGNPTTNTDPSGLGFCLAGHNSNGSCRGASELEGCAEGGAQATAVTLIVGEGSVVAGVAGCAIGAGSKYLKNAGNSNGSRAAETFGTLLDVATLINAS